MRICLSNPNIGLQPAYQTKQSKSNNNLKQGSFEEISGVKLHTPYYLPISFNGKVKKNRYQKLQAPNKNTAEPIPQDFHTLEGYKRLNKQQIGTLRSRSAEALSQNHCFCNDEGMNAFLENTKEIINICKDKRFHLFAPRYKPYIAVIGRSLQWFAEAAKLTNKNVDDYTYVPFSCAKGLYSLNSPLRTEYSRPSLKELNAYRELLRELKMDPTSIINRAKTGQKTIIMDYAMSGESLLAFLEILKDWSLEQGNLGKLKKSVKVVCVTSKPSIYSLYTDSVYGLIKRLNTQGKTVTVDDFNYSQTNIKDELFHLTLGTHDDELEHYYPVSYWGKKPVRGTVSKNAHFAKFRLIDYLTKHHLLKVLK